MRTTTEPVYVRIGDAERVEIRGAAIHAVRHDLFEQFDELLADISRTWGGTRLAVVDDAARLHESVAELAAIADALSNLSTELEDEPEEVDAETPKFAGSGTRADPFEVPAGWEDVPTLPSATTSWRCPTERPHRAHLWHSAGPGAGRAWCPGIEAKP